MTIPAPPSGSRPLRRADLLAQGLTDNHIRRSVRDGTIAVLLPGVYLPAIDWEQLDAAGRYRARLAATIEGLAGDAVVSHRSAGVMHGFIDASGEPSPAHVTRAGPAKSRHGPGVQVHRGRLLPDEVVRLDGFTVTSASRTVLDCLLSLPADPATGLIRRALAGGSVTADELAAQLRRQRRSPGARTAAAALRTVLAGHEQGSYCATVIDTSAGLPVGVADSQS